MNEELMKVFNTRLPDEMIEQIQATAWHKRTTIQAVTETALREFFEKREQQTKIAVQEYRRREGEL